MKINIEKIEKFVEKMMFYHDIPGLVLAIGDKERMQYKKGFGYKNIEKGEVVTEETVFHMASISKLFVGTAVMQLAEKEQVDINETLITYIPYFEMKDSRYKEITVKQMLSHTSGMPDCDDYEWENPQTDDEALEKYVRLQRDKTLLWNPGEKFAYSNIAYEILGHLIANVSGMSFEKYVHDYIFEPIGMDQSSFLTFNRDMDEIASPHKKDNDKKVVVSSIFPYNRIHAPSSTLTSTVVDIYKWGLIHLNQGKLNGKRILEEKTYDTMLNPVTRINNKEKICLSWFARKYRGKVLYGHEGSDIGFRASFAIIPEEALSISVHANIQSAPTRRIQKGILDILFGYEAEIK